MSRRTKRVGHLIQKEISEILIADIADPRLEYITITDVKVTPDLRNATVLYSMMGTDEEKKDVQKALRKATGYIQRIVTQRLVLKYSPKFKFKYDDTLEKAAHMEEVIDALEAEEQDQYIEEDEGYTEDYVDEELPEHDD